MHMRSVIKGKIQEQLENLFKDYMISKYSNRSILCVVVADNNKTLVKFLSNGSPVVWEINNDDISPGLIRKQCGQHAYTRFGLPMPEEKPITMMLLPMPSILKTLGIKKSIELIYSWPGDSKIGLVPVVQYVLK